MSVQGQSKPILPLHALQQAEQGPPLTDGDEKFPLPVTSQSGRLSETQVREIPEDGGTNFSICERTGHFQDPQLEEEWLRTRLRGRMGWLAFMSAVYVILTIATFNSIPDITDGQAKNNIHLTAKICLILLFSFCFAATLYYRKDPGRRFEACVVAVLFGASLVGVMGSRKQSVLVTGEVEGARPSLTDDMQLYALLTIAIVSTLVRIRFLGLAIITATAFLCINIPTLVIGVLSQRPGTSPGYLNEVIRGFIVCFCIFIILVIDRKKSDAEGRETFARVKRLEEEVARMNDYLPEEVKGSSGYEKVFGHFWAMKDSLAFLLDLIPQLDCKQTPVLLEYVRSVSYNLGRAAKLASSVDSLMQVDVGEVLRSQVELVGGVGLGSESSRSNVRRKGGRVLGDLLASVGIKGGGDVSEPDLQAEWLQHTQSFNEETSTRWVVVEELLDPLGELLPSPDCVKHSRQMPSEGLDPSTMPVPKERRDAALTEWSIDLSKLTSTGSSVSLTITGATPQHQQLGEALKESRASLQSEGEAGQVQVQSVQGALPLLGLRLFSPFLDGPLAGVPLHRVSSFLLVVQASYKNMPYHNSLHGAEVGLLGHWLCRETGAFANMSPLVQLAFVTAALCHDVGHPGENNN
eukprot:Cvel_31483.t1-p1 / transcript=Cvel_31483.t1 / gene=Cvel_31483 / organism=Chromera_velia_CCMP2878 / gene_product=Probable 3',5'-cyclic phosphodiesterase pde-1, putative / transcript_product=Probable 3',5'-cyclic phosphodiesterase pde-1, putative / location=Cvel_scaffold4699:4564-8226(+) / protein_length=634 / sequence_SO=supercontig / SO=protein_coding / is_pseudo=false